MEEKLYYLVVDCKGQSKKCVVRSRHGSYLRASKKRNPDQFVIVCRFCPSIGQELPVYSVYEKTLKKELGFISSLLGMVGGPDHLVVNPHYSSGPRARLYWLSRVWADVERLRGMSYAERYATRLQQISGLLESKIKEKFREEEQKKLRKEQERFQREQRNQEKIKKLNQILLDYVCQDLRGITDAEVERLLARYPEAPRAGVDSALEERLLRIHQRLGFHLTMTFSLVEGLPRDLGVLLNRIYKRIPGNFEFSEFLSLIIDKYGTFPKFYGLLELVGPAIVWEQVQRRYNFRDIEECQNRCMWFLHTKSGSTMIHSK